MASREDEVRYHQLTAHDRNRTWDERLDALLALARISDAGDAENDAEHEESEGLIQALMLDDRGKEFIIRAVLRLVSNA